MSNSQPFPTTIEACHAKIRELEAHLQEQGAASEKIASDNERLKFDLEQLKRYIYGQRSERNTQNTSQLSLFGDEPASHVPSEADPEDGAEDDAGAGSSSGGKQGRRHKRKSFPENIPRHVKVIDVPEGERACECCGDEMPVIDIDVRERLEFIPAKFIVHELHYNKRACGNCKQTVKIAPPPEADRDAASLTKGSRYGFGVTAQIILGKYADHLPLYRLEDIFARAGVVIPRSTQYGLLDAASSLLLPLVERLTQRVTQSSIVGMDDTPVRLQDASLPGKMRTARMWLARGRETAPYNVFFFHESRERAGPAKFLENFRGTVVVDAYGVNEGVYLGSGGRIIASCCHAHVRRKFEAAKSNSPHLASKALGFYRQLFDIEDRLAGSTDEQRQLARQSESHPILERFKSWLDEQEADSKVLPKSGLGTAVRYALNQWTPLLAFVDDGRLPMHNNDTERDLRRLTIGRKNWLFFGSQEGGEVAAVMTTLIGSAHRHQLDLWAYLDDVLRSLAAGGADLDVLLPDVWAQSHPESIRTYRQAESLARAAKTKARRALRRKQARR